ncbi:MAG: UDP-N-acetylmuramoyl-tripeptide--D-alanyl-D-alanine ligase, partial [Peptococcaceae bacterium]|nr:UDP-N-acetylmuramoyl-tripeptide--D-alanyl-D-alanine ligase [Peptococcaceae bacterium]
VGQHRDADFRIQNPRPVSDGCYGFELHSGLDIFDVVSPWPGAHNMYNAALAVAAASALGVDIESAIAALRLCGVGDKRLNLFTLSSGIQIIDDTYNASPISTIAALHTLDEVSSGRRIAVLGGMLELGPRTEAGHREVGRAALGLCDLVVAVGDLAKMIAVESEQGGLPTYWCENNAFALQLLVAIVKAGDTILVKGSRGLKMEEIVQALREGVV